MDAVTKTKIKRGFKCLVKELFEFDKAYSYSLKAFIICVCSISYLTVFFYSPEVNLIGFGVTILILKLFFDSLFSAEGYLRGLLWLIFLNSFFALGSSYIVSLFVTLGFIAHIVYLILKKEASK